MARHWSKAKAIDRVAMEMSQTQAEFAEIKAALEQTELDLDSYIAQIVSALPESTETPESLALKLAQYSVKALMDEGLERREAVAAVLKEIEDPIERKRIKMALLRNLKNERGR